MAHSLLPTFQLRVMRISLPVGAVKNKGLPLQQLLVEGLWYLSRRGRTSTIFIMLQLHVAETIFQASTVKSWRFSFSALFLLVGWRVYPMCLGEAHWRYWVPDHLNLSWYFGAIWSNWRRSKTVIQSVSLHPTSNAYLIRGISQRKVLHWFPPPAPELWLIYFTPW